MAAYTRSFIVESSYSSNLNPNLIERLEHGNKVLLPTEVLAEVINFENFGRLIFQLTNEANGTQIYAGVLEFGAPKDVIILPFHLMQDLQALEEDIIRVDLVRLPKAEAITVKANTYKFYELSNPKAVLEAELRYYVSLTVGQTIPITYLGVEYILTIVATSPGPAIDLLDVDLVLEFDPADDTPVPQPIPPPLSPPRPVSPPRSLSPPISKPGLDFPGAGRRLGEKYSPPTLSNKGKSPVRRPVSPLRTQYPVSPPRAQRQVSPPRPQRPISISRPLQNKAEQTPYNFPGTGRVLGGRPGVTRKHWAIGPSIPPQPPITIPIMPISSSNLSQPIPLPTQRPVSPPSTQQIPLPTQRSVSPPRTQTIPLPTQRPVSPPRTQSIPLPSLPPIPVPRQIITPTPPGTQTRTQPQNPSLPYLYQSFK